MEIAHNQLPLVRPEFVIGDFGHAGDGLGQRVGEPHCGGREIVSALVKLLRIRCGRGASEILSGPEVVKFADGRPVPLIIGDENVTVLPECADTVWLTKAGTDPGHRASDSLTNSPSHELHIPTATVPGIGQYKSVVPVGNRSVGEGVVVPGVAPVGTHPPKCN